jgi:hypothetical protein
MGDRIACLDIRKIHPFPDGSISASYQFVTACIAALGSIGGHACNEGSSLPWIRAGRYGGVPRGEWWKVKWLILAGVSIAEAQVHLNVRKMLE